MTEAINSVRARAIQLAALHLATMWQFAAWGTLGETGKR